jgi:hypothetical protein
MVSVAIPFLWENPFSTSNGNYHFIEVYMNNLNDITEAKINEYYIIDN